MQERPLLHHHVAADHRVLTQRRARFDLGVFPDDHRAGQRRLGVDLGALGHPHAGRHLETVDIGRYPPGQHVGLGGQVALLRADILPVAVAHPAVQRCAPVEKPGEDIGGPVDHLAGRHLGQHLRLHHVDAGVHGVREHLAPGGLLQEAPDPAVFAGDHDAELQRVGLPAQRDRDQGAVAPVEAHQPGQIQVGQGVTRDDEEGLVPQGVLGVLHAARGAERFFLGGVLQAHAHVLAVTEVVAHQRGEELHRDHGLGEAMSLDQAQHVLHDRAIHHRQHRLGLVGGHRPQPGPLTARHHDGLHGG